MAEQDPDKKRRALFDLFRRQRLQQQPERSYFDRPEPDREKQRQQAEKPKPRPIPHVAPVKMAKPASANRHDARNTFNRRAEVEKLRQDSILARYKTERQKATALAHMEDAAALRNDAQERYDAAMAPIKARWDRIDMSKPVPGDLVRDLREREDTARETHRKDMAEIETDLALSLKAAHSVDVKVSIQTRIHLLEDYRTPDASEDLAIAARNWPQRFNRAVDPEQDEARQKLRAKVATTPESEESDQTPSIEAAANIDQSEVDHATDPAEPALYEQYEMDWLSVFEEHEKNDPESTRSDMQPDNRGPKPY